MSEMYDVFLSHAVEDKNFTDELNKALEARKVKVWYSGTQLKIGVSLMEIINTGLVNSRYGIIVFSPIYFEKKWTKSELFAVFALEGHHQKRILPILHNITPQDLLYTFPTLADRWALSTEKGIDFIADQIASIVHDQHPVVNEQQQIKLKQSRKSELLQFIKQNQLKQAIALLDITIDQSSHLYNELILTSAQYSSYTRSKLMGIKRMKDLLKEEEKIQNRLLEIINELY